MMDYRENAGYVITDSCHVGESEVCVGRPFDSASAVRYLEMQRPDGLLRGHYFSSLFDAQKIFGIAGAGGVFNIWSSAALIPTRWSWNPPIPPGEKSRPATPFAPALIPSAPQAMAASWSAGSLRTRCFARKPKTCGFMERGYLCFEEDCAAPVALRELMDRGLYQAPVNEYFCPWGIRGCD